METASGHPSRPVLLVTGASGGIGRAVAGLARTGSPDSRWTVVGWDVTRDNNTGTSDISPVDVTDPVAVSDALDAVEDEHGPVASLVHTAGIMIRDDPSDPDPTLWNRMFQVNTVGTAVTCAAVARRMVTRRSGSIVGVTSNAASTPRIDMAAYAASKAAAASFLRSLGLQVGGSGVRVNSVSPGSTLTPMLTDGADPADPAVAGPLEQKLVAGTPEDYRLGIPLRRLAEPVDIAEACLWLASDAARHVTLHDLRVDGGATLDNR